MPNLRILIYGAGVIGSFYAARLMKENDVTVLVRGQRLSDLREKSLLLVNEDTGEEERHTPRVIDRLDPEDRYDFILVPMRCQQAAAILPALQANCSPAVVFLMNGVTSYDAWHAALGGRMLSAFPVLGGEIRDGVVHYAPGIDKRGQLAGTYLGTPDGSPSPELAQVAACLVAAGLPVRIMPRMRDYHFTHAALVCPIANALYRCNTSNYELARNPSVVRQGLLSVRECLKGLRAKGIAITPGSMRAVEWLPLWLMVPYACRLLATPHIETVAARHARNARDEMAQLFQELMYFLGDSGVVLKVTKELGQ